MGFLVKKTPTNLNFFFVVVLVVLLFVGGDTIEEEGSLILLLLFYKLSTKHRPQQSHDETFYCCIPCSSAGHYRFEEAMAPSLGVFGVIAAVAFFSVSCINNTADSKP